VTTKFYWRSQVTMIANRERKMSAEKEGMHTQIHMLRHNIPLSHTHLHSYLTSIPTKLIETLKCYTSHSRYCTHWLLGCYQTLLAHLHPTACRLALKLYRIPLTFS
ncbi:hypothetical protein NDU88_004184, partial [Pleurodeles waltl]